MAKRKVNKSAKVREILAATPDTPAADIAKQAGVAVSQVYTIKSKMGGKRKKAKTAKTATSSNGHTQHVEDLLFIQKVGSLTAAKKLLEDFAVLVS